MLEHKAALEDAQHQLQVLSSEVTLSPQDFDAFQTQQRIRELESTIELSQHEFATEQQRSEVRLFSATSNSKYVSFVFECIFPPYVRVCDFQRLEQEAIFLKHDVDALQDVSSQLVQCQIELSQVNVELATLREQTKVCVVMARGRVKQLDFKFISQCFDNFLSFPAEQFQAFGRCEHSQLYEWQLEFNFAKGLREAQGKAGDIGG